VGCPDQIDQIAAAAMGIRKIDKNSTTKIMKIQENQLKIFKNRETSENATIPCPL